MMSIFGRLFDSFSTRPEAALKPEHEVPRTTRTRVIMLCKEVFSNDHAGYAAAAGDFTHEFLDEIHRLLRFRYGRVQLTQGRVNSTAEDALNFIETCKGEEFLDFLEYIFQVNCWFHTAYSAAQLVS
jgi:hypothetical protein